ncbi:MAG: sporulation integral membrane protein YtvI, partial [Calditerricola sp.]|nr:sporulation integral membrane protein YtvI [Calditerricola sp.]
TFFISKDFRRIRRTLVEWIPVPLHDSTRAVVVDLRRALVGFVKAQLTLTSVTALLVLVGLLLLRVPYAVTIALLTGLVDLLPYLGTGAVFVPWIAYLFITGQIALAIGLSALYVIIIIVRQILEPKVLATNVGLDPLVTLIALFVGLKLWGFVGLIAGPAFVVILGALKRAGVFRDLWTYITRV